MTQYSYLAHLGNPHKIWAVSALHGQTDKLNALHNMIWNGFIPGDKIIYLGNYLGTSTPPPHDTPDTIDIMMLFKNALVETYHCQPTDIIHLRGIHEEMLQKLLQLQFAHSPQHVLEWLIDQGIDKILYHYGTSGDEGLSACRSGTVSLTRWTNALRQTIRDVYGHDTFYNNLKRAAYTTDDTAAEDHSLLFVHAGIDYHRPLHTQKDSFWWDAQKFDTLETMYAPFKRIVRGFDPENKGVQIDPFKITLDDNCDQGGHLICAELNNMGDIISLNQA